MYRARYNNYYYTLIDTDGFGTKLWIKKADLIDTAVAALLIEKLRLTFDYQKWEVTVDESSRGLEEQQKFKEAQLKQLDAVMENLIVSLASLSTPDMIIAVEKKYQEAQAEHSRLQQELNSIRATVADVEKIRVLKHSFSQVVDKWQEMPSDEKRAVVHGFVDRIIATELKKEVVQLVIYWRDGSTDQIQLARSSTGGTVWLPNEIDLLLELFEAGASRVEIAKAFPDRTWRVLYCKYKRLTGKSSPRESHNTIGKHETYNEYAERIGLNGQASSTSGVDSTTRFGIAAGRIKATARATSRK